MLCPKIKARLVNPEIVSRFRKSSDVAGRRVKPSPNLLHKVLCEHEQYWSNFRSSGNVRAMLDQCSSNVRAMIETCWRNSRYNLSIPPAMLGQFRAMLEQCIRARSGQCIRARSGQGIGRNFRAFVQLCCSDARATRYVGQLAFRIEGRTALGDPACLLSKSEQLPSNSPRVG